MTNRKVVGVVLAAGESRRLGQAKQLVVYEGQTLVARAVRSLLDAGCTQVVAVLGAHQEQVRGALAGLETSFVVNENWSRGMGSSIATACEQLGHDVDAVLISLCDQPLIPPSHFVSLIDAISSTVSLAATEYQDGRCGVPAIFERIHFESLRRLDGDRGAKELIQNVDHFTVPLPSEQEFDVDTQTDLNQLRSAH